MSEAPPKASRPGPKRYGALPVRFSDERAFRGRRMGDLDELDFLIIDQLVDDGRTSSRDLARLTGLTEETVAARVRGLIEREIIGITTIFDWQTAGYGWDLWLAVTCDASARKDIVEALTQYHGVINIFSVLGSVDLVVQALLRDRDDMISFVAELGTLLHQANQIDVMVSLDTVKSFHQFAWIPVKTDSPIEFPDPALTLQEIDYRILDQLREAGRRSNREVGRQLGVSDGTVRAHVKRMQDAGLLRVCAQVDPNRSGMINARAVVGISVSGTDRRAVASSIANRPEVLVLSLTAGRHDLLGYLATGSREELISFVHDDLDATPGVRRTETWEVIDVPRHEDRWARW